MSVYEMIVVTFQIIGVSIFLFVLLMPITLNVSVGVTKKIKRILRFKVDNYKLKQEIKHSLDKRRKNTRKA